MSLTDFQNPAEDDKPHFSSVTHWLIMVCKSTAFTA